MRLRGHDPLASHVPAALGRELVLQEDRRSAHSLVPLHDASDILDVAVAVVRIDEHRQVGSSNGVAHHRAVLAVLREIDVRVGEARTYKGKAADLIGWVPCHLDNSRRQGIVRHGQE